MFVFKFGVLGMEKKKDLKIALIRYGTVIDHITPGQALNVIRILGITPQTDYIVSIAMNVNSKKMGKKDIVKVEKELSSDEVCKIAVVAPNATINIIENSAVVKKYKVEIPDTLENILQCPNPNCISNVERYVTQKFKTISKNPLRFKCYYCERVLYNPAEHLIYQQQKEYAIV